MTKDIEREAFEKALAGNSIHNLKVCTIFDDEKNEYFASDVCDPSEDHLVESINLSWRMWQAAKAQAVPEGFVLVPTTPSCEMWSGIARDLGRYMQMHDRYCPKSLKKYFDRFIGEIPEWLNKEVEDWDSDHAFATADLPAFIYMSMVEAQEPAND